MKSKSVKLPDLVRMNNLLRASKAKHDLNSSCVPLNVHVLLLICVASRAVVQFAVDPFRQAQSLKPTASSAAQMKYLLVQGTIQLAFKSSASLS